MNVPPSTDPQINSLVQLLKANLQRKSQLSFELSILRIKKSYIQMNNNRRGFFELLKELILIKKIFGYTRRTITLTTQKVKHQVRNDQSLGEILKNFRKISKNCEIFLEDVEEFNHLEEKKEDLVKIWNSRQSYLKTLQKRYEKSQNSLKIVENKEKSLNSCLQEIEDLSDRLVSINERIKNMKLEKMTLLTNGFKNTKNANIFSGLSQNHLILRSKLLLKQDLQKVLEKAEEEHEKYKHFLTLEKRKLQKIQSKCKSSMKEIKFSFNNFSTSASPDNSLFRVSFETDSSINPSVHLRNFSQYHGLKLDHLEEAINTNEIETLTSSVRSSSQKLRMHLESLSSKSKFVF